MTIQFMNKYKNLTNSEDIYDLIDNDPDKKEKNLDKKGKKYLEKQKNMEKNKEKAIQRKNDRILSSCKLCLANGFIQNSQILKMGENCALIIPNRRKKYR